MYICLLTYIAAKFCFLFLPTQEAFESVYNPRTRTRQLNKINLITILQIKLVDLPILVSDIFIIRIIQKISITW